MDLTTLIFSRPPTDPDAPILTDVDIQGRTITWKQYATTVKSVATGLCQAGFQDQDCAALLSDNDIYFHVLGDAVIAAGGVFGALQTSVKPAEIQHQLQVAAVKWLFVSTRYLSLALETANEAGVSEANIIVFDPPGTREYAGPRNCMSRLLETDGAGWHNRNVGKDPRGIMAYRLFSSGTTGFPKAVNISHAAHSVRLDRPELTADMRITPLNNLIVIPVYHLTSLMTCHRAIIGLQRTFITAAKDLAEVDAIVDIIQQYQIANMLLPPRFLDPIVHVVRSGTRPHDALSALSSVRVAGSATDPRAADRFRHTFPHIAFCVSYGTTELGFVVRQPGPHDFVPGFVGHVADDVEMKFINPESLQEIPTTTTPTTTTTTTTQSAHGEICVRGPQLFSGYHNAPDATTASSMLADPEGEDWFRTGDLGYLDAHTGQLAITGRHKEIFKVANNMVSPEEVERVLVSHPAIEDAVIGPTRARYDSNELEVRAYVVLKKEKEKEKEESPAVTAQEIAQFVAARLSKHKVPTGGVIFCVEIPRNAMKKVIRRQVTDVLPMKGSKTWIQLSSDSES